MEQREIKLNSKKIYEGKIIHVELDEVLCPNGNKSFREIVRHNGGACILGITKDDKIILEKQYRYAYDEILYEIPAGKLELNENPIEAAKREFEEETGYHPNNMFSLGQVYPTVGYCSEILHLFYTDDFVKTKTNLDDDEIIIIEEISFEQVLKMIKTGIIKDAKTICAIYNYIILTNRKV